MVIDYRGSGTFNSITSELFLMESMAKQVAS
jgi:hypothetical protein